MNPDELREAIAYLDAYLDAMTHDGDAVRSITDPDEQARFDEGYALREQYARDLNRHVTIAGRTNLGTFDAPNITRGVDPHAVAEDRSATPTQLADAATRAIEAQDVDPDNMTHVRSLLRQHSTNRDWVRGIIGRTSDDYQSGWLKMVTGREYQTTNEERAALAVGTNTQGGFLVPTHLDPTIILTNSGTSNAIRAISRVVTLTTGNVWNGVTSAGVTGSWDGEIVEVSDDSPSVARVSIPTYKAQFFVQAAIEAFEDISSLTSDVMMMFADARDRLEGTAHATGAGSTQPTGIFTALDANTNVEVISGTAAAIALADLHGLYRSVPVRWRGRSTWVMNPLYSLAVKALGTALSASYTTDLTQAVAGSLLGRPLVESDDAPSTQTTTVNDLEVVFGDFSNYVIVDMPGSFSIEFIPHLFNTTTNLPDGRRGWYGHLRSGADSVNDSAFRLLEDKTSA